jgi:NNP family nitrate/nitrite transporter-like MFS transporter
MSTQGSKPAASEPFRRQLVPLLLLAAIFFLNFLARIVLAPMLRSVERELRLSHADAGRLFLFIACGYCITLVSSGFVSSRLVHHRTIILSTLALGLTLLLTAGSNRLAAMAVSLVLLGMATGFYLPSGIATLTALVPPVHWGKAIAIHELAPNLAFVVAPLIAETLGEEFTWRGVLATLGAASLVTGLLYSRVGKGGSFFGEAPRPQTLGLLARQRSFWIMSLLFSLAVASSMGAYSMIPLYLMSERGLDEGTANAVVAASRVASLLAALVGGWAVDRLDKRKAMGFFLLTTGLLTLLLGWVPAGWLIPVVWLQPMAAVCFFPAGFAALSRIAPASMRNVTVSFVIPIAILLGSGCVPAALGVLGERQAFGLGFALLGLAVMGGTALLGGLALGPTPTPCNQKSDDGRAA